MQAQDYRDDDPEAAQPPQPTGGPRITLAASGFEFGFVRESEDDEEDYHNSIGEAPVIDKLSISYAYVQFISSRPLSDPAAPPLCDFEAYFAVSEPQSSVHPKLCLYSRVNKLLSKSKEREAKLRGSPSLFTR